MSVPPEGRLAHLTEAGEAHMVDVGGKEPTLRRAVAEGWLFLTPEARDLLREGRLPKGDALAVGRVAGIMGAKRTSDLVPLCHPIALTGVEVHLGIEAQGVHIRSEVATRERTGVEMEALTAVAVAGLALYDMVKAVDRAARLEGIRLLRKEGGKSGRFEAAPLREGDLDA